jgi:diguanylate cyclase (GGDEF)-like protein/hemerythrin-like metal-binding protein
MIKQKEVSYKTVSNTLKKRYLPAVILITLIILVEQVMIHNQLSNSENMSHIMNDAGRQRMLSQKIVKDALLLYHSMDPNLNAKYLLELKESVATLEESQLDLLNGNHESKLLGNNSSEVIVLFIKVQTHYEILLNASKELIQYFEGDNSDPSKLEQNIALLLNVEEPYLIGMDHIVSQYEQEYTQDINIIQNTKLILFLILILIIVFELAFLFTPATRFVARIFRDLKEANDNIINIFQNAHEVILLIDKKDFKVIMMSNIARRYFLNQPNYENSDILDMNLNRNWATIRSRIEVIQSKEDLVNVEVTLEMDGDSSKVFLMTASNDTFQNKEVVIVSLFDITSQKSAEETLRKIAIKDELTGLYNRHFLDTIIDDEFERAERYNYPISIIILDLDHFKLVNDTWGHPVGDLVLKQTAEVASKSIRRSDYLIRFGGEEFLVLMPHTNWRDAMVVAEKIRNSIENQPHRIAGTYTASLGVTQRVLEENFQSLYEHADAALYRAKNEGRNRVVMFDVSIDQKHALISTGWKAEWNSGEDKIDEQHKKLFTFVYEILSLSHSSTDNQREDALIALLIQHISQHFEYEESVLKNSGYRDYVDHANIHKKLLEKVEKLQISYQKQEVGMASFLSFLIDEVVIGHLFDADTQFYHYLREKLSPEEV